MNPLLIDSKIGLWISPNQIPSHKRKRKKKQLLKDQYGTDDVASLHWWITKGRFFPVSLPSYLTTSQACLVFRKSVQLTREAVNQMEGRRRRKRRGREKGRGSDKKEEEEEEEKWVSHYSSNHQILLVGEGDFSFSSSLASRFGSATNICASSLSFEDKVIEKYKNGKCNLENLKHLGASILYGVDATHVNQHLGLKTRKFDRIIFNFPHAGFYGREDKPETIYLHRNLVRSFFISARDMLRDNGEIHVNHKTTAPFCCWNIEELACESSLVLIERVEFKKKDYPGYNNKRGSGEKCDEPFPLGACSTFKFRFSPGKNPNPKTSGFNYPCKNHIADINLFPPQMQRPSFINYPSQEQMQQYTSSHLYFPTGNQSYLSSTSTIDDSQQHT